MPSEDSHGLLNRLEDVLARLTEVKQTASPSQGAIAGPADAERTNSVATRRAAVIRV